MKLLPCLTLVLAFGITPSAQEIKEQKIRSDSSRQVADSPAAFFGPFRINGERPEGFENFDFFVLGYKSDEDAARGDRDALVPDGRGSVAVRGLVVTAKGNRLEFESVSLVEAGPVTTVLKLGLPALVVRAQPVTVSFATVEVRGVRYSFTGRYLDEPAEECGSFTYLKGVLGKTKGGRVVAETEVGFVRVAYEQITDGGL